LYSILITIIIFYLAVYVDLFSCADLVTSQVYFISFCK